jgi:flagellar biosynthesis protein FlhB
MVLVVVAIGFGDFLWQRHRFMKDMRMTREEVKREYKEQEGDPHHKQERMRLHKELLQQRMLNAVRKADFVVVNPDHIAVAIRYDKDSQEAPVVVAKGERILAQKIKEIARESGVPIFRDVSLARALRDVEEGDEIPEALYEAVAEILRVVYGGSSPAAPPPAASPSPEPDRPPPAGPAGWQRA